MSDYKSILQSHNNNLQELINMANELPDKVEGVQLNFDVVGGLEQPANPTENMIWVNTDVVISGYKFSSSEPENATEGFVWIQIGNSSEVGFDIVENVKIYPISAKQYISDAWVDKEAKSYQDGAWVDWFIYLIKDSTVMIEVTGNWVSEARSANNAGASARKPSMSITSGSIKFGYDSSTTSGGVVRTSNKIDLTGRNKLTLICDSNSEDSTFLSLCIWSEMGSYYSDGLVSRTIIPAGSNTEVSVDISGLNDGSYYIGFFIYTKYGIIPKQLYVG